MGTRRFEIVLEEMEDLMPRLPIQSALGSARLMVILEYTMILEDSSNSLFGAGEWSAGLRIRLKSILGPTYTYLIYDERLESPADIHMNY